MKIRDFLYSNKKQLMRYNKQLKYILNIYKNELIIY